MRPCMKRSGGGRISLYFLTKLNDALSTVVHPTTRKLMVASVCFQPNAEDIQSTTFCAMFRFGLPQSSHS